MTSTPTSSTDNQRGFTLLEALVAIAVFTIVATLAIGALLIVQSASRKAQATRVVVDNLSFTVDDIVRTTQSAKRFEASNTTLTLTLDDAANTEVEYIYDSNNKRITKRVGAGAAISITPEKISIERATFESVSIGSIARASFVITAQVGETSRYADTVNIHTSVTLPSIR